MLSNSTYKLEWIPTTSIWYRFLSLTSIHRTLMERCSIYCLEVNLLASWTVNWIHNGCIAKMIHSSNRYINLIKLIALLSYTSSRYYYLNALGSCNLLQVVKPPSELWLPWCFAALILYLIALGTLISLSPTIIPNILL